MILTSFTHLWNPIGFPDIFYDEGVYMRRAMHVLSGLGPQEEIALKLPYYDHPYFGQIFLASIFKLVGYPDSVSSPSPITYKYSIELLYLVPRVLMGLLAVLDTFLIYKTAELRYGRNVALIASILFAVMPITWLTRRILLDSIQLPFILSSILFAELYHKNKEDSLSLSTKPTGNTGGKAGNKKRITFVLLSGIFLGLAIFTKIPAFTMIPLVSFIIISWVDSNNTNKNKSVRNNDHKYIKRSIGWNSLIIWLIPVILIPAIWPANGLFLNHFNYWLEGLSNQTTRQAEGKPLYVINLLFMIDPVILVLGLAGLIYGGIKRDFYLLFWAIPYIIFLYAVGFVQYFHIIPLIPMLCISVGRLIIDIPRRIVKKKKQVGLVLPVFITCIIAIFGLMSTVMLIATNVSSQFEAAAFAAAYLQGHRGNTDNDEDKITLVSSPVYSWIFTYVYKNQHTFSAYRDFLFVPVETNKILLIADPHFKSDSRREAQLKTLTKNTDPIATFNATHAGFSKKSYPYTSLAVNREGSEQEVRLSKRDYSPCILYDKSKRLISVSCNSSSLSSIDGYLDNHKILHREGYKVWLLNANIKIENNSNFYINSSDTSWLKINSTFSGVLDKEPNHILSRGNLIVDNVKITSWDTTKNDYALSDTDGTIPRSYILVNYGNGTTNITNSELAYLGYDHARSFGLTYYTGAGSIIKDNEIHDLQTGFYSDGFADGAYNITIEGNEFYNNTGQGIAPHSGSHHLTINNNTVHHNGREGIICSTDCYSIIIDSNRVFNNTYGIQLNDNITNSIIKNNLLYDNKQAQIWLDKLADNNSAFANKINDGLNGIMVSDGSANNTIDNNTIANSYSAGIYLLKGASQNTIISNTVNNSTNALSIQDQNTSNNSFSDNNLLNSKEEAIKLHKADNTTNKFENNTS